MIQNSNYQVVISEYTLKKIKEYQNQLVSGQKRAGEKLKRELGQQDLTKMSTERFIDALLNTKEPRIFAEEEKMIKGGDWNLTEFSILGDINIAAKVKIYDNGIWSGDDIEVHTQLLNGTLLDKINK